MYANVAPDQGWRGITCFLVPADRDGVSRGETFDLMGGHALGTGEFSFHDVRLEPEDLLIPPGDAFKAAMSGIDLARVNVAAMCCGMLRRGIDEAIGYMKARQAFGKPISEQQGLQWMVADAATDLAAASALTDTAIDLMERDEPATVASAHAKKFATRVTHSRLADCMQVMGARGYRADVPLGRHLAAAKMAQYLDGTTEIQNVVISRALFRT
jgi:alkylation response protein AidB-like acyl-CoA dehydrogenase